MHSDEELMQMFLMGDLNEQGFDQLNQRLVEDSNFAKHFADLTRLDSALYENLCRNKVKVPEDTTEPELFKEEETFWGKIKSFF